MMNWISQHKFKFLVLVFCFSYVDPTHALDLRKDLVYGIFGGFGGTGVEEDIMGPTNNTVTVSRNEGPLVFGLSVEMYWNEKWTVELAHRRGIKFGPLKSGVGFTGVTVRRYFLRPVPYIPAKSLENSVTIQRWAPFVGLSSGFAIGRVQRDDAAGNISGSGIFFGINIGVDYPLKPNMFLRPQVYTSATFMDDSDTPAVLEELGLGCSILFRL